ncbi:EamA/RhaT family transporter [Planomicrobium sp. YIM 101495]|uniref:EamA/RhaT family transporter n=1 Tax=Planomicrobium sp. YIM 101495 TaxID=2665160 RepID=UPI0012B9771F|nr:EamA/RhaT family transporter [Planomicrobium sp. YIM 101495]MTD30545.1 EamA/RhaT family transporter [Planomicrobium sp. YIM 101495]
MKQEQGTSWIGIILMIAAAGSTATGQLFWKLTDSVWDWELWLGFMLYGMGAVLMTVAFRFGKLSVLHPLLSIGYVIAVFYGAAFLNEAMTMNVTLGTLLILIGVVIIGGDRN